MPSSTLKLQQQGVTRKDGHGGVKVVAYFTPALLDVSIAAKQNGRALWNLPIRCVLKNGEGTSRIGSPPQVSTSFRFG